MIISYQGADSFKISQGDLSVLVNPPTGSRSKADVTLYSAVRPLEEKGDTFVITGPGEYEVKGIVIKGFLSEGQASKLNTIYLMNFEGMNLCFLGALSNPTLDEKILESLEDIDILFVPANMYKLAVSLEPSLIIPMLYPSAGSGQAIELKQFLKEGGEEKLAPIDKLVVKKKDLENKKGDIVILKEE